MDLNAVRTFVAVADAGQFQKAAADLSLTQQAVSKRIATLEQDLGVRLFDRTARGVGLTIDGQAFLPHARTLLRAEERAAASVRPESRALRVDVIGRRVSPAGLLRAFHDAHPEILLDVMTLFDADQAVTALQTGTVDATFRAVTMPGSRLPEGIASMPVFDEPLQLCVGPAHPFAEADAITPSRLTGQRVWMPGNLPGTEWGAYYDAFADAFDVTIDTIGPDFGVEALLDAIAGSDSLVTFFGERTPLVWPVSHDLRRIPLRDPTPVYPHSLLWRTDNPHPALTALRDYLAAVEPRRPDTDTWVPAWAERPRRGARTGNDH
ncbi:LysR family transcriptional regulator [Streptomyces sp. MST-110588]|uniref:LysR family transcriptional regulator n=1 Tax=Streptomyces sp. MST-110588 TaxID=2833628 RepID=UPI001F5C2B0E|nr:LysR family transcriptional regulator [Streptomyces sp. MST-110588]UNO38562.1 LysR family transcriptional regulator [Streptomyces sp. MST-110588]